MPWRTMALVLIGCRCTLSVLAAESLPYTASVTSDHVAVRSGPGENYYPVLELGTEDTVLVYRHDPGGWSAIRPPEGSFSWVCADFLQPDGHNLAEVTGDRVACRVGSALSNVRDVIQIRLDRGEQVELLTAHRFRAQGGAQTWYKISPPPGEFRWIHNRYLKARPKPLLADRQSDRLDLETADRQSDRQPDQQPEDSERLPSEDAHNADVPSADVRDTNASDDSPSAAWRARAAQSLSDGSRQESNLPESTSYQAGQSRIRGFNHNPGKGIADAEEIPWPPTRWQGAKRLRPPSLLPAIADEPGHRVRALKQEPASADRAAERSGEIAASQDAFSAAQSTISPDPADMETEHTALPDEDAATEITGDLKGEIAKIDRALSTMVAGEIAEWELTELHQRAEKALEYSLTPADRDHARRVLKRIERFSEIQRRYLAVMALEIPGPR